MAKIFVSHSKRDVEFVDFFNRVAGSTKVALRFMEFEALVGTEVSSREIRTEIEESNAVFILLSQNVDGLPHTRDWVLWEAGVASNKDVWVFERASTQGKVDVITPHLRDYVVFEPTEAWYPLVRSIVESYDDSHVLPTMLAGTGIGALLGKGQGAAAGAGIAALISDKSGRRPRGFPISCDQCHSTYGIILPKGQRGLRCPVCNAVLNWVGPPALHAGPT